MESLLVDSVVHGAIPPDNVDFIHGFCIVFSPNT
jgi:hypothetical protein